jgi:hypothetical protein
MIEFGLKLAKFEGSVTVNDNGSTRALVVFPDLLPIRSTKTT